MEYSCSSSFLENVLLLTFSKPSDPSWEARVAFDGERKVGLDPHRRRSFRCWLEHEKISERNLFLEVLELEVLAAEGWAIGSGLDSKLT